MLFLKVHESQSEIDIMQRQRIVYMTIIDSCIYAGPMFHVLTNIDRHRGNFSMSLA